MRCCLGHYNSLTHAELALRRWRGLYGDPEKDPENQYFRIRYYATAPDLPYSVVSFTECAEADEVDEHGEIT